MKYIHFQDSDLAKVNFFPLSLINQLKVPLRWKWVQSAGWQRRKWRNSDWGLGIRDQTISR